MDWLKKLFGIGPVVDSCSFCSAAEIEAEAPITAGMLYESADDESEETDNEPITHPEYELVPNRIELISDLGFGVISGIKQWIRVAPDQFIRTINYEEGCVANVFFDVEEYCWCAHVIKTYGIYEEMHFEEKGFKSYADALNAVNGFVSDNL